MTNSLRRRPGWKWGDRRQTKGGEADAGLSGDAYGRRQRGRSDLVMMPLMFNFGVIVMVVLFFCTCESTFFVA